MKMMLTMMVRRGLYVVWLWHKFFFNLSSADNYEHLYFPGNTILNTIISLDKKLDLAEQYNPVTKEFSSAETLTWNYSELYFTTL